MLKTALIFQDHMILQHEKSILFWGITDQKDEICIMVQGKKASGYADANGKWRIVVGPLHASFREEIVITCGNERKVLSDVQVGEVWLAGGQSNMEFHMRYDENYEEEMKSCNNPDIRFFDYPEVSYIGQIDEADYQKNYGKWRKADADNLEWFSAVGYYFAKEIQKNQEVPVGIIGCNWGGTPACAWMDQESIHNGGGDIFLEEYKTVLESLDMNSYEQEFAQNPGNWKVDPFADLFSEMMMRGYSIDIIMEKLTGQKLDLSDVDFSAFTPAVGPKYERRPMGLYESMLKQLAPFGIRGFIYYQGETDGDTHPECYDTLFPALIECWRKLWKEKLPFLFVQLAPFGKWMACDGVPYAMIREAQQKTSETVENVGMAVISDVGMEWDIHPKKKQPVGYRLALQAENKVYGQDVICEAPILTEAKRKDSQLILKFENVGEGLHLMDKDVTISGMKLYIGREEANLSGIEIEIKNDTVILYDMRTEMTEGYIIFGEGGWYSINLYNSAEIPVRPCRCDIKED